MRDHKGLNEIASIIRKDIVTMIHGAKSGHPGGSLSAVEILTALYFDEMNIDPTNPKMEDRDRFILSKGHAAPALYSALARRGYLEVEELNTLRKIDSRLQGHPNMNDLPGIDMSTGSLGQGISAAVGMALAGKLDKKDYRNGYWKCRWCGKLIPKGGIDGYDYVQYPAKWYYHVECYEEKKDRNKVMVKSPLKDASAREEQIHLCADAMYRYIKEKFHKEMDFQKVKDQLSKMLNKHENEGWTLQSIYKAFKYYYEVQHGDYSKSRDGIGIIPYIYDSAMKYYAMLDKKQKEIEASISKEKPKETMLIVPRMEKERKREIYNIEEW